MKLLIFTIWIFLCLFIFDLNLNADDKSIGNTKVKLEITQKRTPNLKWYLNIYRKSETSKDWELFFETILIGNFNNKQFADEYRKEHNVYYVFQKPDKLEKIKTEKFNDSQSLKFRVVVYDKFWLDSKITIFNDSAFVLFECTGKSNPKITPHWAISFKQGPLFEFVSEKEINAKDSKSIKAKDLKGNSFHQTFEKYGILFRKSNESFPVIIPYPGNKLRVQLYRKGGMGSFWLNTPFILYPGEENSEKEAHTMGHIGEGLYSQLKIILEKYKNNKKGEK